MSRFFFSFLRGFVLFTYEGNLEDWKSSACFGIFYSARFPRASSIVMKCPSVNQDIIFISKAQTCVTFCRIEGSINGNKLIIFSFYILRHVIKKISPFDLNSVLNSTNSRKRL